jgi:hypothetical protein
MPGQNWCAAQSRGGNPARQERSADDQTRKDKEMKGGWRADLIGLIAVGGFVVICTLILTGGAIVDSMKDVGLILIGQLSMRIP